MDRMMKYEPIVRSGVGGKRNVGGYLWVSDVARSMTWYRDTLDLSGIPYPSKEPYIYANLLADHLEFAFLLMSPAGYQDAIPDAPIGGIDPVVVKIDVDNIERLYHRIRERVGIHTPLAQGPNGRLSFAMEDPDHHLLTFQQIPESRGNQSSRGLTTASSRRSARSRRLLLQASRPSGPRVTASVGRTKTYGLAA